MNKNVEAWTTLVSPSSSRDPRDLAARAARLEADGWDGATLVDSQCLMGDAFSILTLAAVSTTNLKLGTGTSNPVTRHPSVLANLAATVQVISEGRMSLGLGRGDSALAYIGARPATVATFDRALAMVQAYLRGTGVPLLESASMLAGARTGLDEVAIAHAPEVSKLEWLPDDFPAVEVEVAASGPKVIAAAARHADCISFALGANTERLKWGMAVAREEMERAGRDPATVRFGAYVPLYPHPDIDVARELSQGIVTSHSRFSVMNKAIAGPVSESQRANLTRIAATYDMTKHGDAAGSHSQVLDADYIDGFALVGDPDRCAERICELVDIGIERFNFWTADTEGKAGESYDLAVSAVLPKVPNRMPNPAVGTSS
ncbi:LLM class flavin-dependent oxidoreductase [Rhodococcus opacus]|nr:LLM class flavin-dependent oxidoreductase [Rhodococcus opacus]